MRNVCGTEGKVLQKMEENLRKMEDENKGFSKMQQDHRIRSRVYEKILREQEQFWKGELSVKEEQLRQMEMERDEWRDRETFWVSEMEALVEKGTEATTWVTLNFAEAYKRFEEGMISLENMKLPTGDKKKKISERRWRKKEREDRMESRASVQRQREECEEESDDDPQEGLRSKTNGTAPAVEKTWSQQTEQMDGKWGQVKDVLEMMRGDMEQRSMMGSKALKQDFTELYGRLAGCGRSMARVKRELDDKERRKEVLWRRLGLRIQMGGREAQGETTGPGPD